MRHCLLPLLLIAAVVQLSGCGAYRNYDLELEQTTQQFKAGNIDGSLALIEAHNPGEDKDLLYYFEKGSVLSAGGDLPQSQVAWRSAEQMIIARQDTIQTATDKWLATVGNQLGSIINDKLRRYDGYDYEKVMLTTQMALNQLALNDFDGARADIRKTHEREDLIARQRELEYERIEEAAKAQGAQVHYKDLQGYPVVMLESPAVMALKNGYQSAFSHYLAGFTYEALGEKDLAAPGYRHAIELRPDMAIFQQALHDLDNPGLKADESDVLIIVQSGLAPGRSSVRVPYPVRLKDGQVIVANISFPVMVPDVSMPSFDYISVDGRQKKLIEVNSITNMSLRTLRDDMPGIIQRTTYRAFLAADVQGTDNRRNPDKASYVTQWDTFEQADTRIWRTLPDLTQVVRLRLKKGEHLISLSNPTGGTPLKVRIEKNRQVINLRALGNRIFANGSAFQPSGAPAHGVVSNLK
ncbi:COG3014 family protein [Pseudomonas sp. EA_5y_Pfl2_R50]|uniref:COG3014 family protein n=1 Tax=Pseudomonas sp. EA_5y_Pfl2_R50 TaxID=3088691 RepID=UPI0030DB7A02